MLLQKKDVKTEVMSSDGITTSKHSVSDLQTIVRSNQLRGGRHQLLTDDDFPLLYDLSLF